ncbi:MAG: single-stranded DNA-binding protein [Oscillospiraceae bacterium]|nr:single-stranded DNA-binding protein [Oscillospiraceae bacterium]
MNVVALIGRLTGDVEVRQTPNGVSVCSFSIAVDRYTNGERKADFINCVAWRETGENIARFFRKGHRIGINGSIQTRQYQDRDTGKNRTAFEVLVDRFHFCEKSEQAQPVNQYAQPQNYAPQGQIYGNPRQNLDINPQPMQVPKFQPQQQGLYPQAVPKFMPQQQAYPQSYPPGFEPVNDDDGDRPF